MFFWSVTISVIFAFSFLPIGGWLYERNLWRGILFLSLTGVAAGIFLLVAGVGMAIDWEIPMLSTDNAKTVGQVAAKAGGKGAVLVLVTAVWPYFLILLAAFLLFMCGQGIKHPETFDLQRTK